MTEISYIYPIEDWIYVYRDENSRYILGTKGNNPLIVFGINPSTAAPNNLDNTLKSVERIAKANGFDSWIMFNVYPQRATNPNDMDLEMDTDLHKNNIIHFEKILNKYHNATIWAAWGTVIKKRNYLETCLKDIIETSKKYNCKWVSAGNPTKDGYPKHPLYLNKNTKLIDYIVNI